MNDATTQSGHVTNRWHVASWPPLAWLETVIKLVALVFAIVTFVSAADGGSVDLPGGAALAQLVVLAILSLGLVAAIGDRWIEREIVAMAFVVVNNLGHWGMVAALLLGATGHAIALFAALMMAGDLVKLLFIAAHTDFQVRDFPRIVLYALTSVYVVGYALLLVLELLK